MLRIYCLQQWYSLSDPGAEEALDDICSMRTFAGLELGRAPILVAPGELTECKNAAVVRAQSAIEADRQRRRIRTDDPSSMSS